MSETAPPGDPAELTRYIETRYHARLREQLPQLAGMAADFEAGGDIPGGLSAILRRLIGDMEVHMKKEELILFPAIRRGGMPGIEQPIAVMRADHLEHEREMARLRTLAHDLSQPDTAEPAWVDLRRGLEELLVDLEEHIRLENEVLFPIFENEDKKHG